MNPPKPCPVTPTARHWLALGLCGLLSTSAAWFPGATARAQAAKTDKPRIALVMKSLANEFFLTMEKGARDYQTAHAGDFELLASGTKNETDVSQQINLVEQAIGQHVDAIVIAPADSKALIAACKKAMDAGIVVINIDNKLDADVLRERSLKIPFVGPDNRAGAKLAGDFLAKQLQSGDKVIVLEGVPSAFNSIQRRSGFEDSVKAAGLNLVATQSGSWETAKANQVTSALLTEHPDVKAILAANDNMALGVVSALRQAGKTDAVKVVGFDNISAVQALIKEDKILATVDQHGDKLAVFGIEYALKMLKDKVAPEDQQTPVDLVTRAELK